jgi:dTDP-4-dehydrorhamnose 3,5-epimerase
MEIFNTPIIGAFLIKPKIFQDDRGAFVKTFHQDFFSNNNLCGDFKEGFYSTSKKNVIRGMHFQIPPHDHVKIVNVTKGSIKDVILDIRVGSPTYGKFVVQELCAQNGFVVYIPKGCAHGFLSLEDESCVSYLHSTSHAAECDTGIRYDSFGMDWGTDDPIISKRDKNLVEFENFNSPFIFGKGM